MRVTSKGQVTIPIDIRNQFGIRPNTEVRFVVRQGHVILEKSPGRGATKRPSRGEALLARMRSTAQRAKRSTLTTDELMRLTRDE